GNRIRSYPLEPLRGIIYDKNNIPLAINVPKLDLMIIPVDLKKNIAYGEIIKKLSIILEVPESVINEKLEENSGFTYPIIIAVNVNKDKAILLESEFSNIPEIKIQKNSKREYQDGPIFSHVLGYLGKVTQEEIKNKKYLLDDSIGRTGVEQVYDNLIRGVYGEELTEINNLGQAQKVLATKQPVSGEDLILSIDAGLQKVLYQSLKTKLSQLSTSRAAAVAMDPRNGKILALVSFPSFDNNSFIEGDPTYINNLFKNSNYPLINRVISGGYPSGSTIKPMLALAALQENIIDPLKNLTCPGYINLYNESGNVYWTFKDWDTHGTVNMIKAIAESCDVYFYSIGGGYGNQQGLGADRIKKYLELFGWGQKTGIDLPGEKAGFIPDEKWKQETKNEKWYIGDTYNISIGQGDITMNPLQLTSAISAVANNGKLYKPQLLQGSETELIREIPVEQKYFDIVKQGMRETIISGSAKSLNDLPVHVAGKTGTAETYNGKVYAHSWFTAFAPYENPEIVITILIENGAEIGGMSTAVAKEALNWYFAR
ncbi:MAG: penicillin-binding protein 2, partial [Candidatus Portnoybacteria bacterium]|nr:penicillin-binding protein 2 [Candidatus Portnoybacteria bacterium]